jgi:hypothetical protein
LHRKIQNLPLFLGSDKKQQMVVGPVVKNVWHFQTSKAHQTGSANGKNSVFFANYEKKRKAFRFDFGIFF